MIFSTKDFLRSNLVNCRGFKTNRKIIVIESDDWGTVRMQSKEAYNFFLKKGYPVDKCGYNKYDSLESNEDIEHLLDVLSSIKSKSGSNPKFTINNIVANPNFEKIYSSGYSEYYFERFIDTLSYYPNSDRVYNLYKQGIKYDLLKPQFHGREHVNVLRWLEDLRLNNNSLIEAFKYGMFSVHSMENNKNFYEYMDTLSVSSSYEQKYVTENLIEGIKIFTDIWGYSSNTFIAPCFIWHSELNKKLESEGVYGIQGYHYQNEPTYSIPKYRVKRHYFGEKLSEKQYYLMRNVTFEPSLNEKKDWISSALKEIDISFFWNKPAIISTHRVNYVGRIHPHNRINGLLKLKKLLEEVINRYPDVEFMDSSQLLNLLKLKLKYNH